MTTEFTVELCVVLICAMCIGGSALKIWTLRGVHSELCRAIREDWLAENGTYVIGMTYALARLLDVLGGWHYGTSAVLTGGMCLINFVTSIRVWRVLAKAEEIAEGGHGPR